ncbi:unnamed protein product [Pleuronectes platessa]|uniref:Uncharacterized protein n=1 Tax=Pleuronectes platessa TaxID=8262 RepID=A0A9N7V4I7_PLEPL|nr:unnamed protein product [Pleuronectes platessa]
MRRDDDEDRLTQRIHIVMEEVSSTPESALISKSSGTSSCFQVDVFIFYVIFMIYNRSSSRLQSPSRTDPQPEVRSDPDSPLQAHVSEDTVVLHDVCDWTNQTPPLFH